MSDNLFLRNLVHHAARRGDYRPTEGGYITISLPGEMLRAVVLKISSDNAVVAKIDGVTMGKTHNYRKGDIVPCRRIVDDLLKAEKWEVISDREIQLAEVAEKFDREERARALLESQEEEEKSIKDPYVMQKE